MIDRDHCVGCPLEGVVEPSEYMTYASQPYMVITDTPTVVDSGKRRMLSKAAQGVFFGAMRKVDFGPEDFYVAPQVLCPHLKDSYTTKELRTIQSHCRNHLAAKVREIRPEVIIPLGAEASKQVLGRAVKITKIRGAAEYSSEFGTTVLPLLSPGQVVMYPQHQPVFDADCATLGRLVDAGMDVEAASEALLGDYEIVEDLQFLVDAKPKILFFDTENVGLEFFHRGVHNVRDYDPEIHSDKTFDPSAAVLTMQFCISPGKAYMLVWDHPENPIPTRRKGKIRRQLIELLCNPDTRVVGQNSKYDATYIFACLGIRYKIGGDTLMLATLIDENAISKNQDVLVKRYVPEMAGYADQFNATVDKSKMWKVPLSKLLGYGCGDSDSGMRLYKVLIRIVMQDTLLTDHYMRVSLPGLNAFAFMETRGLEVDQDALDVFAHTMQQSVEDQYRSLLAQVPASIKKKHIDKGLQFSRPSFTLDMLFLHNDGLRLEPKVFTAKTAKLPSHRRVPSLSSKDHLPYFFDEAPFTMELAQYMKDKALLGTNVMRFRENYIHDGLVRPTYSLSKAVTGRSSSENPNGQNFPKRGKNAKAYRRIFRAPAGHYVIEADLSQAELRIAAHMANERTMLGIYRRGGDIHSSTAAAVLRVSEKTFAAWKKDSRPLLDVANEIPGSGQYLRKLNPGERRKQKVSDYYKAKRQEAKAVNFGFIYGMGWRKFIGYAKTQYGVDFTEEEAMATREAFFEKYSDLPAWHEKMRGIANKFKQVRSCSGRLRHLPMIDSEDDGVRGEAGRQAINSPVQEFGSSLGIMAIGRMSEEIDEQYLAPIAFVHDAIYTVVPYKYLEWGAKTVKWYMESNPLLEWFGLRMRCPIVADVSFGLNLGDTNEMEGLTLDGEYDFSRFWDAQEGKGIQVPEQEYPENDGLLQHPPYTRVAAEV